MRKQHIHLCHFSRPIFKLSLSSIHFLPFLVWMLFFSIISLSISSDTKSQHGIAPQTQSVAVLGFKQCVSIGTRNVDETEKSCGKRDNPIHAYSKNGVA